VLQQPQKVSLETTGVEAYRNL